jgi:hypothetical protein
LVGFAAFSGYSTDKWGFFILVDVMDSNAEPGNDAFGVDTAHDDDL